MTIEGFDDEGNAVPLSELKMGGDGSLDKFTNGGLLKDDLTDEVHATEAT